MFSKNSLLLMFVVLYADVATSAIIGPSRSEIYGEENIKKADQLVNKAMASNTGHIVYKLYELQLAKLKEQGFTESTRDNVWIPYVRNPRFSHLDSDISKEPRFYDLAHLYKSGLDHSFCYPYQRENKLGTTIVARKHYEKLRGKGFDLITIIVSIKVIEDKNGAITFELTSVKSDYSYSEPIEEGISSSGGGRK